MIQLKAIVFFWKPCIYRITFYHCFLIIIINVSISINVKGVYCDWKFHANEMINIIRVSFPFIINMVN